jgi:hypothetical protein
MKKPLTMLVAVVLLTLTVVHAQQPWVSHKVNNRVSFKFPSTPREFIPGSFMSVSPDSSVVYIFTLVDFAKVANLDSAALAPVKATPEFAAELKKGMKQSLPDVSLSDFAIGKFNGFTSYSSWGFDPKKKRYDMFMFIIGTNFYSFSTVTTYGTLLSSRDRFFASIRLTQ